MMPKDLASEADPVGRLIGWPHGFYYPQTPVFRPCFFFPVLISTLLVQSVFRLRRDRYVVAFFWLVLCCHPPGRLAGFDELSLR